SSTARSPTTARTPAPSSTLRDGRYATARNTGSPVATSSHETAGSRPSHRPRRKGGVQIVEKSTWCTGATPTECPNVQHCAQNNGDPFPQLTVSYRSVPPLVMHCIVSVLHDGPS